MQYRLLALLACVACGSVSSKSPDASGSNGSGGTFTLTVAPHTVTEGIGGSMQATVAVARSGNPGDIALTARDLPAGVTVTFATPTLATGTDSSDLTITSGAGAVPGMSTITIVGTANGVEMTDTIQLTLTTITVSGHVQGNRSGITVGMIGKTSVTSDASGNFTFTDVTPPYSIYTVVPGAFTTTVFYYDGLYRPDPVIAAGFGFLILQLTSTAPVTGSLSGNGTLAGSQVVVAWGNNSGQTSAINGTANAYSLTAVWPRANTVQGTLYGLQWTTRASLAPNTFPGYAQTTNVTLTANTAATVNLNMSQPTTAQLTGTITSPAGFPQPTLTLTQQLGNTSAQLWSSVTTTADSTIPVIPAGKSCFSASAALNGATSSFVYPALAATTDVTYTLPDAPAEMAPADAATGVNHTTAFQFTPTPMSVSEVSISTSGTTKATYNIITTNTSVTLPTIPEVPLPSGQSFSWTVYDFGPLTSLDAAATDTGLVGVYATDFTGTERFSTNSAARTFTSQ